MKKLIITLAIIALVAAASAAVLAPKPASEELPTETRTSTVEATARKEIEAPTETAEAPTRVPPASAYNPPAVKAEEKAAPADSAVPKPQPAPTYTTPTPVSTVPAAAHITAGCTIEYTYDENGEVLHEVITYPVTYTGDEIWIDGKAYVDVPSFGLTEVSDKPSQLTIVHGMYESGNKVGIMGG